MQEKFVELFENRIGGDEPKLDDVVFGSGNKYGLESMDILRFVSALLPIYGDKVYDLKVEEITTLRHVHDQLEAAE